ncbi:MAG: gamma-glutamyl-gamma-aminobutyrate hydrolase family protein [Spirochaetes bacterium]|nr:gamma-glutamyl-gamma-aminobutyrate hydrolase family protein [Spirochaetota bacterium]
MCGGCQLLNIASGGKLVQHLGRADAHTGDQRHEVEIVPGSSLARIFGAVLAAARDRHREEQHA